VLLRCFQEFTDSTSSHSLSGTGGGYVNAGASNTEFTIFPPANAAAASHLSSPLSVPGDRSSVVRFEPLPDIRLPHPHGRRPAAFNSAVSHGLSSQDWFREYYSHVITTSLGTYASFIHSFHNLLCDRSISSSKERPTLSAI
jgi:hypothetical protein